MKTIKDILEADDALMISQDALAALGAPKTVYIREVLAGDMVGKVDGVEELPADGRWHAHGAYG